MYRCYGGNLKDTCSHEMGSRALVKSKDDDRHLGISRELWKTECGIIIGEH